MKTKDARSLSPDAQEDQRRRVVKAVVESGMSQTESARVFSVSRQAVNGWVRTYGARGAAGLKAGPKGRPRRSRLAGHQAALAVRLIEGRCPDQLKLPFALWTREAVVGLLAERFDRGALQRLLGNSEGLEPARWSRRVWMLLVLGIWDRVVLRSNAASDAEARA